MFKNITLELSLKPFKKTDTASIREVCEQIVYHWRPLLKNRTCVSVMLWVGDGSELLDFAGDLDTPFEWCRFVGTANLPYLAADAPRETSLHSAKQDYMQNAPVVTYRILKTIITELKSTVKALLPQVETVRVGETFDIGPEFALSDFKYTRHPEICTGTTLDTYGFVDATATLHGDTRPYAAFPDGIPEGTPFGTFLGKQAAVFLPAMGFDYLWLSNGLGFSADPWDKTGKIFDGKQYYPEKLEKTKTQVFRFWQAFREACPDIPLETRGTNNSVGIDYATDGVPLYDLYTAPFSITAPPNSPWAALNDNYGLEMMGYMSRVCELPSNAFPFRYYLHDPWWVNSPWYDRYDGSPCDVYLPMAVSRMTAGGNIHTANSLNILSIDNSFGNMPDACVNEVIPHLLKAEKDAPDAVAPLLWVYPLREYTTTNDAALLKEMNEADNFVCDAINAGFPLCSVISTDNFVACDPIHYQNSILLSPVPEEAAVYDRLAAFGERGGGVLLYGSKERLSYVPDFKNCVKLDTAAPADTVLTALSTFGIHIRFDKNAASKPPTSAIYRRDGAIYFSVYNADTTTKTCLRLPQGAPVLCGTETKLENGFACYHFDRAAHRECRVFVEDADGVISCREAPPVNTRFRRAIRITGLKNATVRLFSETGRDCAVSVAPTDDTPQFDPRFSRVQHPVFGEHLFGENVSGTIFFLIEY